MKKRTSGTKGKSKKARNQEDELKFIKDCLKTNKISATEVEELTTIDHPLFSFKYLRSKSIKDCNDSKFFYGFLIRLHKLSTLGWDGIRLSDRHSYGMESLPKAQLIPDTKDLPEFVTPEVDLHVFRSSGDNKTFVGLQRGKIFYIFFIESRHGDICPH